MDTHFANMRSLIQVKRLLQTHLLENKPLNVKCECEFFAIFLFVCKKILDAELFELMHQNGDYTHFYFCYRWFLLDFKRGNDVLHIERKKKKKAFENQHTINTKL